MMFPKSLRSLVAAWLCSTFSYRQTSDEETCVQMIEVPLLGSVRGIGGRAFAEHQRARGVLSPPKPAGAAPSGRSCTTETAFG